MEHSNNLARDGNVDESKAQRVIELATKARLAQRTAAEFLRRWAVELAVENVGLVAISRGAIDLPARPRVACALESERET